MYAGGGPAMFAPGAADGRRMGGGPMARGRRPAWSPIAIAPADYQAFEQLLVAIQAAWSAHDLNTLRALLTPEMLSYFGEQLAEQTSRGVRNAVTDVRLLQGDLARGLGRGRARIRHRGDALLDDRRDPRPGRPRGRRQPDRARDGDRGVDVRSRAGRAVDPVGDPAGAVGRQGRTDVAGTGQNENDRTVAELNISLFLLPYDPDFLVGKHPRAACAVDPGGHRVPADDDKPGPVPRRGCAPAAVAGAAARHGFTPDITCLIVPSLPAASIAWNTHSIDQRSCA